MFFVELLKVAANKAHTLSVPTDPTLLQNNKVRNLLFIKHILGVRIRQKLFPLISV